MTDRSSVKAFAQWGLADSVLGFFTFSRIPGSAACGGGFLGERQHGALVLASSHLCRQCQWFLFNGWGR